MNHIFINKPGNTTAIAISVNVGSRSEEDKVKGIAHFIEHMCFKVGNNKKENQFFYRVEKYGGEINAFTDREITCYWVKVANEYIGEGLKVVQDLALRPIFPRKEIIKERQVVLQELKMYKDAPKKIIHDNMNTEVFTKDSSLHYSIIGTEKTLYNINRKEMLKFYNKYYTDANMTLIMVGDVKDSFRFDKNYKNDKVFNDKKNKVINPEIYEKRSNIEQANVAIGNHIITPNGYSKIENYFKLTLLDAIYGGGSGRLFDSVREKHHLVYGIKFFFDVYSDEAIAWYVTLGLDADKIQKAKKLILQELQRPVTQKEIDFAISKYIGEAEIELDDTKNVLESIAYAMKNHLDYKDFIVNYKENIKNAAKDINKYIKKLNFKDNILSGVIPK